MHLPHLRSAFLGACALFLATGLVACVGSEQLDESTAPAADQSKADQSQADQSQADQMLLMPQPIQQSQSAGLLDRALDDEERESRQRVLREAWFEEMHRTPPGVDWRALERDNARSQAARRAALVNSHAAGVTLWSEKGSNDQAGNVMVSALSPDGQTLYSGSALGGLWSSDPDGSSWAPLSDAIFGGVHHMATIPPSLPGLPDPLFIGSNGGLVFTSRDGGNTWSVPTGIPTTTSQVRRIHVSSDGLNTVYIFARQGGYKLFRSIDQGYTFQEVYNLGSGAQGDIWVPRDGSTAVYLLGGGRLRKSTDQGATWTDLGGLPLTSTSGELSGCANGGLRLYAMLPGGGQSLYRSDDEGASWTLITAGITDYWGQFEVSSVNPDLLSYGGVECFVSDDAGLNFSKVNTWGAYYGNKVSNLHADIMDIQASPNGDGSETWYVSCHGGLYRSFDSLNTVENLSLQGLRVSQYYSTHTSSFDPDHLVAGTQDQGYQIAITPATTEGVLGFAQPISGDYAHLVSGSGDHDYVYSVYPGFVLIDRIEGTAAINTSDFPAGEVYAWLPPLAGDPLDDESFFFCATAIWRYSKDAGNTWTPTQWTPGPVSASISDYVTALAFSPLDPMRGYCATNSGKLYWSDDRGVNWTQSADNGPGAHYFYGNAINASAVDKDTVTIGGSGYGVPAVYRSTDGGKTFQTWGDDLPDTLVYSLAEEPGISGAMYCGTETSAYRRGLADSGWIDITDGVAPATTYWSLESIPSQNTMRFGTYGRGIWDYVYAPKPSAEIYGCGVNPAGSLVLSLGEPIPGTTMGVTLDNPIGNMTFGALSYMLFSFAPDPNYPCGTSVPNLGMAGSGAAGELLVSISGSDPQAVISGSPWFGVGIGAVVVFDMPDDNALLGVSVFGQGLLFDPTSSNNKWGLTEGLEMLVGR
ncbi:MAG: photosystem II stability/assembly factor-like uncharacterized protein [Planctomycetota bacterium]|jgi:photosystem II stability/assembly factor-like uncharacterized protein